MGENSGSNTSRRKSFIVIIIVISILMILFGLVELVTSFTHQFFGLSTLQSDLSTVIGAFLGLFYISAGVLLFFRKFWASVAALVLLAGDIVGRIAMVVSGLYPLDSFRQAFGIIAGTLIAFIFAVYIFVNIKLFQS